MTGDAIIELVIAKGDVIITHGVHDVDDVTSVRGSAQATALDKIAIGHNGDILVGCLHLVLESGKIGVSVNATMDVVLIKHDDVLWRSGGLAVRTA